MLRIGEFSRLSGLSVKALRFYDDAGVFPAARVDSDSGYRYYTTAQLRTICEILALRELGVSLSVLARGGDVDECLRARRDDLSRDVARKHEQIVWIDKLLAADQRCAVVLRQTPSMIAASLRAEVDSYADCDGLLEETFRLASKRAPVTGRGAVWHQCETDGGRLDCEALVLLEHSFEPRGALKVAVRPEEQVASAFYQGNEWASAYASIGRWIAFRGFTQAGPKREQFLDDDVTEVQVPVR